MPDHAENPHMPLSADPFSIRCNGGTEGSLSVTTRKLSVTIAQRIVRGGIDQMWDFLLVLADRKGTQLTTRVLLCHPDWDEPVEVASIESNGGNLKVALTHTESRPP